MTPSRITLTTLIAFASLFAATHSVAAQESTARFSTTQTGCKVWNPQPAVNETVYWSGDCVNGYGEGKGIIIYGVTKNGRAELSMSDTTLENGKQHGYGIAHFSNGGTSKRYYENGQRVRDVTDMEYENNTLIKNADIGSMKAIIKAAGLTYQSYAMNENRPYIIFVDSNNNRYAAFASACTNNGHRCSGININATFTTATAVDMKKINELNYKYAVGSAFVRVTDPKSYSFATYIILNDGRSLENLSQELQAYVGVTKKVKDIMNEN